MGVHGGIEPERGEQVRVMGMLFSAGEREDARGVAVILLHPLVKETLA